MPDITAVFKAYDIRGLVPQQLDAGLARAVGAAFAAQTRGASSEPAVVIGHDMRTSSPGLAEAFSAGVRDTGTDAVWLGLASTDLLYFASGRLGLPGAMFTASHNPAAYNGIKLCGAAALPMSAATGLDEIRRRVEAGEPLAVGSSRGTMRRRQLLSQYADHLLSLAPVAGRRLRVVVDAGNGMAGMTVPEVFGRLDIDVVPLYFELDGTFPNHEANPLDPANLADVRAAVVEHGADVGLAFDGDADRCFVVDEGGRLVSPSALTALIAVRELTRHPGAPVVYGLNTSRAVPDIISRHGGVPVRAKVGHSLVKATMAETDAVFGGEHTGHYYFRDFWYADSGMLAALHLLGALAGTDARVSELIEDYEPYAWSGEINSSVADPPAAMRDVEAAYASLAGTRIDRLDGITAISKDWWFNVRSSNTESVLRLNVEATTIERMIDVRDQVLAVLRRQQ